jgi:glycosyltransferase involved in cell wall biosynthesis
LIARTLRSIREAAGSVGEPHEILVVDDASGDGTAAIAHREGARVIPARCRQISATRNAGAREAKGEYLIFVDADTVVNAPLVRAALGAMKGGAVGGGSMVQFDGSLPRFARVMLPLLLFTFRHGRLAAGCFLFCTREAFQAVGGFDEAMFAAEEIAMSRALGRCGRFVVLSEFALTSGRKLRAYSGREIFRIFGLLISRGSKAVKSREDLWLWYGPRREDPEADAEAKSA